jgi:hypothetical protein
MEETVFGRSFLGLGPDTLHTPSRKDFLACMQELYSLILCQHPGSFVDENIFQTAFNSDIITKNNEKDRTKNL